MFSFLCYIFGHWCKEELWDNGVRPIGVKRTCRFCTYQEFETGIFNMGNSMEVTDVTYKDSHGQTLDDHLKSIGQDIHARIDLDSLESL